MSDVNMKSQTGQEEGIETQHGCQLGKISSAARKSTLFVIHTFSCVSDFSELIQKVKIVSLLQ